MSRKKNNSHRKRHGYCKLTGRPGAFVNSHIIPEALTRPSVKGAPLFQYGDGPRLSRHWTSWYDSELVTRDGEDVLSSHDTWAISALRQHKLIWSGWGTATDLGDLHTKYTEHLGIREVELDTKRLRLFFLSLLWRAAASTRREFRDIKLSSEDLELLRLTVIGEAEPGLDFWPTQLTQISTRGIVHNQTPYNDVKYIPNLDAPDSPPFPMPTVRFYFDGLVAHLAKELPPGQGASAIGNLIVGAAPTIVLSTVSYEDSFQGLDMAAVLLDYHPELAGDSPPAA